MKERAPTKEEAAHWLREHARLLGKAEADRLMARRLQLIADCIEGTQRFHKPPKLPLAIMQRLDMAANLVESLHRKGMRLDEAVKQVMRELRIDSGDADQADRIHQRILQTRRALLNKLRK